jgi:pyrroloquinoline quinone biosynthesis protein B
MGARNLPVHAMPRMAEFLRTSGPWSQLVSLNNIAINELADGEPVRVADDITVTPVLVPHRAEYTEVVAFIIDGPNRSALFLPDIDSWDELEGFGTSLNELMDRVDIAYLDATFYDNNEIPNRDMSAFPHPRITETVARLKHLPPDKKRDIFFIHLNHTNQAQWEGTPERRFVEENGFRIGERGDVIEL